MYFHPGLFYAGGIINTEKSEGITHPGDIGKPKNPVKATKEVYSKVEQFSITNHEDNS